MERRVGLEHLVRRLERRRRTASGLEVGAVARRVHVREVEHRPDQADRAAIASTSSTEPRSRTRPITSTPKGTARPLASSRSRSVAELVDDRRDRVLALAAEQEARVEDDDLGAARRAAIPALRSSAPTADLNFVPRPRRGP